MKKESFLNSLWFNAAMSVVAVVLLITNIIDKKYIMIIIWLVITYHYVKVTFDKIK